LEIENFQFAIATEAGALLAQSEMSQEQTEKEKFCQKCAVLVDCTTEGDCRRDQHGEEAL
jgi:hypothetical protein